MTKACLTLILLLLLHFNGQAQDPGYIVNLKRDTIKGFIQEGTDAELSSGIKFRTTKNNKEGINYSCTELLGFGFDYGRVFKRISVKTSGDSVYFFAKRVLQGKITLYVLRKKSLGDPDFFLINNESQQGVMLNSPKKEILTDGNGLLQERREFKYLGLLNFIKTVPSEISKGQENIAYNETKIIRDIASYNDAYQKKFPTSQYMDRKTFLWDFSIGIPVINSTKGSSFRIAVYRNKIISEKFKNISFITGISYRYWRDNTENKLTNGLNYRQQVLSYIPIGFKYQSSSKYIRPYVYLGAGLAILIDSDYHVVNSVNKGSTNSINFIPILNMAAGVKVKVGNNWLFAEVTPIANGSDIFANIGYSF